MDLTTDFIIVVDTREQLGYQDLFESPHVVKGLPTGDYSILGAEHLVSVERKSVGDLLMCLGKDRERFEKELARSCVIPCFHLMIEGNISDLLSGNFGRFPSRMNPKSVIESLTAFSVRYRLPVWLADCRLNGARLTESLLQKWYREHAKTLDEIRLAAKRLRKGGATAGQ